MPGQFEPCRENLEALFAWYQKHEGTRNEATTRLHLIDRIFLECLGWSPEDIAAEEPHGPAFADYTFSAPRKLLIVEAKREGISFELPAGETRVEHSLVTLLREYPDLRTAIKQASGYCQSRGIPFGAVTNGHQIVALVATRNDGLPPLEGRALVFTDFPSMLENFRTLWDVLSKPGVEAKKLYELLIGEKRPDLPVKLAATLSIYPGIKGRNVFQQDLQIVSELVLEDLARAHDLEARFLEECYCSTGALSQYALTSRAILEARYSALFDEGAPGPTTVPVADKHGVTRELVAESLSRRPVLLIGDVGVGKSTFIRYLIKVHATSLFEDAISIYLDLGTQATLSRDLRQFVVDEIARQLLVDHGVDIEEGSFVRGVYDLELKRFSKSIYGELQERAPDEYRQHEVAFLSSKVEKKEEHLRASLNHIAKGRRKQIVVFLDNSDQRDEETQQQTFLISQEMAEHWPAMVFVALRPETFHRSLKVGALTGYHPKAFTISPPRIDLVIQKRLTFGLRLTCGEIPLEALGARTKIRSDKLEKLLRVFLRSLSDQEMLAECIENISAGNVRVALDLVKGFFGSGHVDTEKIVRTYDESGYDVPVHEFLRAVIYGDAVHYDPVRSPLANLFDVAFHDVREHFILCYLISVLSTMSGPGVEEGFVETERAYERLQRAGFTPEQIDAAIIRAHRHKLLETGARRIPLPGRGIPNSLRATTVGIYHVTRLVRMFTYVDAMIVDTPIFDGEVRKHIRDVSHIDGRLERAESFRRYLDDCWQACSDIGVPFSWREASGELSDEIERIRRSLNRVPRR